MFTSFLDVQLGIDAAQFDFYGHEIYNVDAIKWRCTGVSEQAMPQQKFLDCEHSLSERIHGALGRSPYCWSKRIHFEMDHDYVVLKGVVRTYYQKQLAQESVRTIKGVQRVRNEIQVIS